MLAAFTWTICGVTLGFGLLHLTARVTCRTKGHRWRKEERPALGGSHYVVLAFRCKRCRRWADLSVFP